MVVAAAVPLNVTVAPLPAAAGLIVPERVKVCAVAVKFTPVTLALETVAFLLPGLNVNPAWLGVTVYVPFAQSCERVGARVLAV